MVHSLNLSQCFFNPFFLLSETCEPEISSMHLWLHILVFCLGFVDAVHIYELSEVRLFLVLRVVGWKYVFHVIWDDLIVHDYWALVSLLHSIWDISEIRDVKRYHDHFLSIQAFGYVPESTMGREGFLSHSLQWLFLGLLSLLLFQVVCQDFLLLSLSLSYLINLVHILSRIDLSPRHVRGLLVPRVWRSP